MTVKTDTGNRSKVAKTDAGRPATAGNTTPLVGNVTAGAQPQTAEVAPITLLSLLQDAQAGEKGLPKPKRRSVEAFLKSTHNADCSEFESELSDFIRGHKSVGFAFDDAESLEDVLLPENGGTAEGIVSEYLAWRAARRIFCAEVRAYLAAVDADETRRREEEAPFLKA